MIKIKVGNSYSQITGLSAQQEKQLKNLLSYTIGGSAAYFSGYGVRKKSLLDKKGNFPTGLLSKVCFYFKNNCVIENLNPPKVNKPKKINNLTPYSWQNEACNAAFTAKRGIISAVTGTGKSAVIALIAARFNLNTLVVVPSLEIKKQLSESLLSILGRNHNCIVENIDSGNLNYHKDFDVLIIDEAHHSAARTYQKLNKQVWNSIYYRFFLTATPFRNDNEETLLFQSIAGDVIYNLEYKEAVSKGYIVPVEAFYVNLHKKPCEGYTWAEVYKELIINNESRNRIIENLMNNIQSENKSVLCLVKEIKHGEKLNFLFVNGLNENSRNYIEAFNKGTVLSLVATTGIMGEGVDTKPCEYVIIAGLGKAKSQFMQQVGRAVRKYKDKESAKVIIFRDPSHKFTLRHFNEQKKILKKEYGVVPIKLDI